MRLSWVLLLTASVAAANPSSPAISSVSSPRAVQDKPQFEVSDFSTALIEPLLKYDTQFTKRDLTSSFEEVLKFLNKSDLVFNALDEIAYDPLRIEKLANGTIELLGDIDLGSVSDTLSKLNLKLNINSTDVYNEVMDSGVVTSLLDGIFLDSSFRPVLVNIVSRLLKGNKDLIYYLMRDVLSPSKRDKWTKRDNTETLETFVVNVVSTALSSKLVGDSAKSFLAALNGTQFLTYTAKKFIAHEGYQNMTAQFMLDMINSGRMTLNAQTIDIPVLANQAVSYAPLFLNLLSKLSSSDSLPALGKYTSAMGSIFRDVEDAGLFADLNRYVFSETHSVQPPVWPTAPIVVPRTAATKSSMSSKSASTSSPRMRNFSEESQTSASSSSEVRRTGKKSLLTTTSRGASAETDLSEAESAAEVSSILSVLKAME